MSEEKPTDPIDEGKYTALSDSTFTQAKLMGAVGMVLIVVDETQDNQYAAHTFTQGAHKVLSTMPQLLRSTSERISDDLRGRLLLKALQQAVKEAIEATAPPPKEH